MLFFLREGSVINPKLHTALDGYYFVKERCRFDSYLKGWLTQKSNLEQGKGRDLQVADRLHHHYMVTTIIVIIMESDGE